MEATPDRLLFDQTDERANYVKLVDRPTKRAQKCSRLNRHAVQTAMTTARCETYGTMAMHTRTNHRLTNECGRACLPMYARERGRAREYPPMNLMRVQ